MTDEELLLKTAVARRAAHDAPRRLQMTADGGATVGASMAWADRSREWMQLASEVDRRGLKQPDLNHGS